jgi:hypothetical protein
MSGFWIRFENGLIYLVSSSDMADDERTMAGQELLAGHGKELRDIWILAIS